MVTFYDTHAHLDYPDFAPDFPEMLTRAMAAGITKLVAVGIDLESSKRCVQLAEQHPEIFAAVGWHPNHANKAPEDLRPALRKLARRPKVVAIGETGMDYFRLRGSRVRENAEGGGPRTDVRGCESPEVETAKRNQARLFEQQLEVAAELGLNAVVHQRAALEDTLTIMGRFAGQVSGQFHCFADDTAAMQRVFALGSIVSFTGLLTYKNTQTVCDALTAAPLDCFMFETDSPYLVPEPHRANRVRRCEPAFVRDIAELAARVRGCTLEELSAATCATAEKFFKRLS